jgi:hypothetical protein
MIRRSMESEITQRVSAADRDSERLDRPVKVLVINGILVVPEPCRRIRHLISNEGAAIHPRLRFDWFDGRSRPGIDGRNRSHCRRRGRKSETCRAAHSELAVRDIVIHVAFPGMTLAPGVLMRSDVLRFAKIRRAGIHGGVQVIHVDQSAVGRRCARVAVAGVISRRGGEDTGERIDPCARTQAALARIQARAVRIGASRPKTTPAGRTAKAAGVAVHGGEGML